MPADTLVLLAAGRGTRMDPLTRTRPKVLLPVAGRPLLEHLVRAGVEAGFGRIVLVVHAFQEQVRAHFDHDVGCRLDIVEQGEAGGTGHAVAALDGHVDDDFVLAAGDGLLAADDLRALADAQTPTIGAKEVEDARPYGLLHIQDGRLQGILEKPEDAGAATVNTGAYRLPVEAVAMCRRLEASPRGERELTDVVGALAAEQEVRVLPLDSWRDAGRPWDLLDIQADLMRGLGSSIEGELGPHVETSGPVVVEPGAHVAGHTVIEGPAVIGRDARVGPNAYIRPATAIGAGCRVGNAVEIKNSILLDGAQVPHLSYVGDSVLGADCNLGAGTQVANLKVTDRAVRVHWQAKGWIDTGRRKLGAILGDGVKTGVNCSLDPGTVVAPGYRGRAGEHLSGWLEA